MARKSISTRMTCLDNVHPEDILEKYFNEIIKDSGDIEEGANFLNKIKDKRTKV